MSEPIPTTLSIAVNPEPSWIGQSTQLRFTITPDPPENIVGSIEGKITVTIGDESLPELEVTNVYADTNYTFSGPAGTVTISARFDPESDSPYVGSENEVDHEVVLIPTTTLLTLVPENSSMVGENIVFKATVTAADGSTVEVGSVAFYYDGVLLYDENVVDGQLTYDNSFISAGEYVFRAVYTAAGNYEGSESQQNYLIEKYGVEVTIEQDNESSMFGAPVTFTATVTARDEGVPNPTSGTVTFYRDGDIVIGTKDLDGENNTAQITTDTLPPGKHNITAQYGGNTDYDTSTSLAIEHTVRAATKTTVTPSPLSPSPAGQEVTFTITVRTEVESSYNPQGNVRLFIDNAGLPQASLGPDGTATIPHTFDEAGTYTYHAVFLGDEEEIYLPSESDSAEYVVTELTLTSNYNPSWYGQMVTFTAQVDPAQQGVVTFIIEGNQHGPVPVGENGTAQLKIATLAPGYHQVIASFTRDSITLTASLTQVVYYCCRN